MKQYSNGEVMVVWHPSKCWHVGYCVHELPEVFDESKRPWVNMEGMPTERIIEQVRRCPSGALSCYLI